jgi:TolB-like protein
VRAQGDILSRDDLVDQVWGGRALSDEAVLRAVSRLRRAAGGVSAGVFSFETVPKAGYRLRLSDAPASGFGASAPAPAPAPARARGGLRRARLVVLPFRGNGDGAELLAQGLSAVLADEATRISGVDVLGHESALGVPDAQQTSRGIAQLLCADLVTLGEVRAEADRPQVDAQLVGLDEATPGWSGSHAAPLSHFFRLAQALLAPIACAAGCTHVPAPAREVDPEELRLYLLGLRRRAGRIHDVCADAEALFARAAGRDPGLAEAWADLGSVMLANSHRHWLTLPRGTLLDRDRLTAAVMASERATVLRPELSAPMVTMASAMGYLGAWTESHRAAEAVIRLGGRPTAALLRLGHRRQAVGLARREVELNPLDRLARYQRDNALRVAGGHFASAEAVAEQEATYTDMLYDRLMRLIEQRRFAEARRALYANPDLLTAVEVQYAPMTRDYFLYLMEAGPRPNPEAVLARIDAGDGYHEMAAIMFARMGAMRHASLMLERMGADELPVIHMIFGESCSSLHRLDAFGRLVRRTGLAAFWSGSERWPDFSPGVADTADLRLRAPVAAGRPG